MLTDSVGDGLGFWFQPHAGHGRLQLKDTKDISSIGLKAIAEMASFIRSVLIIMLLWI